MDEQLIKKLQEISVEEQAYLNGSVQVLKDVYTKKNQFEVDSQLFLKEGKLITVRPHSRFVEFPMHKHDYIEMFYVCAGEITHCIDGREIKMQAGDFLMLNQHVKHGVKRAEYGDVGINFIVLPEFFDIPLRMMRGKNALADFLVGTLRRNDPTPQYLNFHLGNEKPISNLMENMIESIIKDNNNENVINQYSMGLVFLYLLNHLDKLSSNSSNSYEDIIVRATLQYIDSDYRSASLSKIADDFNMSLPSLSRLIKKNTGLTFQEHLMGKRFGRAVTLLEETKLPVEQIVENAGYENQSYFYRQFKARFGMTPNAYRKAHNND
ncbi:MAG: AraC family transcriptional regulator [Allobaculum sp.]